MKLSKHNDQPAAHSNLSYNVFEQVEWHDNDLSRSLLNGTVICEAKVSRVIFHSADLEATKLVRTSFSHCSFTSAGIRSIFASNCTFINTSFDDACISDSTFENCSFINCSFNGAVVKNNVFQAGGSFVSMETNDCEFMLNIYRKINFAHAAFDNAFNYQIFSECHFNDVSFEAYILGFAFGLSSENLSELDMNLMGKPINYAIRDLVADLTTIYFDRGMFINIGILQMYIANASMDALIIKCISLFEEYVKRDALIKNEELAFFLNIINELTLNGRPLMPITYIVLYQKATDLLTSYNNMSLNKARSVIMTLHNEFHYKYLDYLDSVSEYKEQIHDLPSVDCEIVYNVKPLIELANLLSSIIPGEEKPYRFKVQQGSFIEWLRCPPSAVNCLEIFISLLGITIPIVYDKNKQKNKSNHRSVCTERSISVVYEVSDGKSKQKQALTITLPKGVRSGQCIDMVQTAVRAILEAGIINDPNHSGYSNENMKSITAHIS